MIRATQVNLQVAADDNVYALADQRYLVRAVGTASHDGQVWLVADAGSAVIGGNVRAADAKGSGGPVDTAAQMLTFLGGSAPFAKMGRSS